MDNKQLIIVSHIGTLIGYTVAYGNFIVPLVIWLTKKDESEEVANHAKESLNFQISMCIYTIAASVLSIILIGIPILIGLVILNIVCVVQATLKADKGGFYTYPLTIRLVK